MKMLREDRNILQQLEESLWLAETRFDVDYMEKIFAADMLEIGRSGRTYTRDQLIRARKVAIDAVLPLEDLKIRLLSSDVAQVTYNSHVSYDGVVEDGRRSSIWSRSDGSWVLRFHQGTAY